ncbi:MAG: nucleoside triphosphate pyrophosphohydrolase [Mailhella sp.]|nr:nucleoside triphosphate pyrophosphohydrolase [Mailhella sp.]
MNEQEQLLRFQNVIDQLIDPEKGCPWDKEQTALSMCEYLIEECHELVDAIRSNKPGHACDEMGDLLFVLLLMARRFELAGQFSLGDALKIGADKMVRRHPHVFSGSSCDSMDDLMKNWAAIKKAEKEAEAGEPKGTLSSVPSGLPPLTKAYRVHAKAAGAGFTWDDDEDVERQVEAEWLELLDAKASGSEAAKEHELGDMIFTLVELGRRMGVKAASAVDGAANRFRSRFEGMEALARERGLDFKELSLDDKDELWNEVKAAEPAERSGQAVDFAAPRDVPEA